MRILTSKRSFRNQVSRAFQSVFQRRLVKLSKELNTYLSTNISKWVYDSPEIQSIVNREVLYGELGIPPDMVNDAVEDILNACKNTVTTQINKKPFGIGGIDILVFPDLTSLINLPTGQFLSNGNKIEWLKALLTSGDSVIVKNYHFMEKDAGRTGKGIMVKGGLWRVPPEYSGTIESNFITRSIDSAQTEIEQFMIGKLNA